MAGFEANSGGNTMTLTWRARAAVICLASLLVTLLPTLLVAVPAGADGEAIVLDVDLDIDGTRVAADWPYVAPGEEIIWNYSVTNNGADSFSDLTISDARGGEVCSISELLPSATEECKRVMVAGETMYATTVRVLQTVDADPSGATLAQSTAGIQVLDGRSAGSWLPAAAGAQPAWPVQRWAPPAGIALLVAAAGGWFVQRHLARRQAERAVVLRRARTNRFRR